MLHGILDVVVDGYIAVAEELGVDIEQIEEQVFSPERTDDAATIYKLKRENLELRRAVEPLTPVAADLVRRPAHRDPRGAARRTTATSATTCCARATSSAQHDNLLGAALEASRSRQAVQQNEDMRKISAWVAIAAVPTMIAGDLRHELRGHARAALAVRLPRVMIVLLMAASPAACSTAPSSAAAGSDLRPRRQVAVSGRRWRAAAMSTTPSAMR